MTVRQSIDLLSMTDHKAGQLANLHVPDDYIFAIDHTDDKGLVVEKVQLWRRYSTKSCKVCVHCGNKFQGEHDIADVFECVKVLMTYGALPYIVRNEAYIIGPYCELFIEIMRWCNQPRFCKKVSFREFCIANQKRYKEQTTNCAAYQSMLNFEKKFPKLAKEYFDLKFDELNIYKNQYGYGRWYANKPLCSYCQKEGLCWDRLLKNKKRLLRAYLSKQVDVECLRYKNAVCSVNSTQVAKILVDYLLKTPLNELIEILGEEDNLEKPTPENIPQFSNLEHALIMVPGILSKFIKSGTPMNFEEMGYYLERDDKNAKIDSDVAMKKYGENHVKLATLVDLAVVRKNAARSEVTLSEFGKFFVTLDQEIQKKLALKLCLRIPIVRNYFLNKRDPGQIECDLSVLSKTTQKRRRSNVIFVVRSIEKEKFL